MLAIGAESPQRCCWGRGIECVTRAIRCVTTVATISHYNPAQLHPFPQTALATPNPSALPYTASALDQRDPAHGCIHEDDGVHGQRAPPAARRHPHRLSAGALQVQRVQRSRPQPLMLARQGGRAGQAGRTHDDGTDAPINGTVAHDAQPRPSASASDRTICGKQPGNGEVAQGRPQGRAGRSAGQAAAQRQPQSAAPVTIRSQCRK